MEYLSTRDKTLRLTAAEAIKMGLSRDGVLRCASEAGLELADERLAGEHFYLVFRKEDRHGRYHDSADEEL